MMSNSANKVLILFPWGIESVIQKSNGAGVRVGLLAEFLERKGFHVTVFSIGRSNLIKEKCGITYIEASFSSNPIVFNIYGFIMTIATILKLNILKLFIYYHFFWWDKSFRENLEYHINKSDLVFLEYPFWSKSVAALTDNFILTNHDLIAKAWCDPKRSFVHKRLFSFFLRKEIAALKAATASVVVSKNEQIFFKSMGLNTFYIPNPIMLPDLEKKPEKNSILTKYHIPGKKQLALFVGSGWYPNQYAVTDILNIIAPKCPAIHFCIIGECSIGRKSKLTNISFLGRIESKELEAFYRKASFVVIPLRYGTGMSVKAIEAMAYGKVILSTKIGAREIDLKHNVNCVLCDAIDAFPLHLNRILNNREKMTQLGNSARMTAEEYDYERVFTKYLTITEGLS